MPAAPPALVLITGDEELLVDRTIARALAFARRSDPDVQRWESPAAGLEVGAFEELVAPTLFGEPRVVVVRNAQESAKELATALLEYAAAPVDGVTLVVQHSGGARNKPLADGLRKAGAHPVAAAKISKAAERIDFVRTEIREAGGTTTPGRSGRAGRSRRL